MIKNIVRGFFHLTLTVTIVVFYFYLSRNFRFFFVIGSFSSYLIKTLPLLVLSFIALIFDITMLAWKKAQGALFWGSLILEPLMLIYWLVILRIAYIWSPSWMVGIGPAVIFSAAASLVIASRKLPANRNASFFLVLAGAFIGVIAGLIIGFILAWIVYKVISSDDFINIVPFCALAGFIAGAGFTLIGIRTRTGLEWALVTGLGFALPTWIISQEERFFDYLVRYNRWGFILLGMVVIALSSWLVVWLLRLILRKGLPRGPFQPGALVGYSIELLLITIAAYLFYEFMLSFY